MFFEPVTEVLQQMIVAEKGRSKWKRAVDATMGNGNDSLFLFGLLGDDLEQLYGFDVQENAIVNSRKLFMDQGIADERIHFILDGHENWESYVEGPVDTAIFNLGYLPRGDKHVVTKGDTTLRAISGLSERLSRGGVIGIVAYRGHEGGEQEYRMVERFVEKLDFKRFHAVQLDLLNRPNNPPCIILLKKK